MRTNDSKRIREREERVPRLKTVAIVGGIMTLQSRYRRLLRENNFDPCVFNQDGTRAWGKVGGADVIVLFSGTVSHTMATKARKAAASGNIPLVTVRRSSVSALKRSIPSLSDSSEIDETGPGARSDEGARLQGLPRRVN